MPHGSGRGHIACQASPIAVLGLHGRIFVSTFASAILPSLHTLDTLPAPCSGIVSHVTVADYCVREYRLAAVVLRRAMNSRLSEHHVPDLFVANTHEIAVSLVAPQWLVIIQIPFQWPSIILPKFKRSRKNGFSCHCKLGAAYCRDICRWWSQVPNALVAEKGIPESREHMCVRAIIIGIFLDEVDISTLYASRIMCAAEIDVVLLLQGCKV